MNNSSDKKIDDLIEFKKKLAETDNVSNDSISIINKPSSRYSPNRHDGLNWDSKDESVADHPTTTTGSQILWGHYRKYKGFLF